MKEIQLTKGKVAIVDDEDYEWLNQWKWHVDKDGYAVRRGKRSPTGRPGFKMHREILGLNHKDGLQSDHINGNKFDNRKSNLRVCNPVENGRNKGRQKSNKSGFKGVHWCNTYKKWKASIRVCGKRIQLGFFKTPEDASRSYCEAAIKYHGEFANFGDSCVILENKND